jgi:hypothetical protein
MVNKIDKKGAVMDSKLAKLILIGIFIAFMLLLIGKFGGILLTKVKTLMDFI